MKIKVNLKKTDKLLIGVAISVLLMILSIASLALDYVIVDTLLSWRPVMLIFPFILFAVLMVMYDKEWEKEHEL